MSPHGFEVKEFLVERWMNTYENDALFNLAETDAKPFTLEELLSFGNKEGHWQDLLSMKLAYNPTLGSDRLRRLIASQYEGVLPEEVLVTTGAIEANFLLASALVKPGDTVIVQSPAYQALYSVAEARGAKIKHWRMKLEDNYVPDMDVLEGLIDERTRAVVVNVPHNPTGAVLGQEKLQKLIAWAEEKDFWIICDEVYHDIELEKDVLASKARSLSPKAISVGSFSKSFGLSGLRLGWFAANPELVEQCWSWKDYTSISISPLNDYLACLALENREEIMHKNIALAQMNLEALMQWFEEQKKHIEYVLPKAGLLTFPRFRDLPISTEQFCLGLFEKEKVLLMPGECFDHPGYLRIGYGNDHEVFTRGLDMVAKHVRQVYDKGR